MDREGKIRELADELGKSVVKQLLINIKYTQYNFNWIEYHVLAGHLFEKIEDQLNQEELKDVKR